MESAGYCHACLRCFVSPQQTEGSLPFCRQKHPVANEGAQCIHEQVIHIGCSAAEHLENFNGKRCAKAKEQYIFFRPILFPQQGHQKAHGHKEEKVQQILQRTCENINEQFKIEIRRKHRFCKQQPEHARHCHKACHIKGKEP